MDKKIARLMCTLTFLAEASEEWTREFLEDATWNVMDKMVENVGRALGEEETKKIISFYGAVDDMDLAGGGPVDQSEEPLNWIGLVKLHNALRVENWRPTILALNETQLHQLLNDEKFVHAQYLPSSETDLDQATVTSVLGMKILASTLIPNGTAFAVDTRVASVMLLRRDVNVEDWEDAKNGKYGVRATTRFGLGVLKAKAVGKITNIATTLT